MAVATKGILALDRSLFRRLGAGVQRRVFGWLARQLRMPLAETPLFWGHRTRVQIGENVSLCDVLLNSRSGRIVIEDYVFFGHGCMVLTGKHDFRLKNRERLLAVPPTGRDIIIRRGAWIASNVTIIGPAVIGEDAVVCAGSVVIGDIEPCSIYAGNPARKISAVNFDTEEITGEMPQADPVRDAPPIAR